MIIFEINHLQSCKFQEQFLQGDCRLHTIQPSLPDFHNVHKGYQVVQLYLSFYCYIETHALNCWMMHEVYEYSIIFRFCFGTHSFCHPFPKHSNASSELFLCDISGKSPCKAFSSFSLFRSTPLKQVVTDGKSSTSAFSLVT